MNNLVTVPISINSVSAQKKEIAVDTEKYKIKSKAFHNLKPQHGEKILDIGCGDGSVTLEIKKLGCQVTGIDIDASKIEAARQKGVEALLVDAKDMFFDKEYDAVFSLSALHWMRQPNLVLDAVSRALKPQGRFVAEMSAYGNLKNVFDAFLDVLAEDGKMALYLIPWYLPTEEDYSERLEQKGFSIKKMETNNKKYGIKGSLGNFVQSFLPIFNDVVDNKQEFIDKVVINLENRLEISNGYYQVDYSSIDFVAVKEKEIA